MQKLMGLFGFGKKNEVPQAPTLSEEKKQVSEITAKRESLRVALEKVRLSDPTGQISQKQMEKYATVLIGLRKDLAEKVVYGLDTRAIDKILVGFAEQLDVAIGKGHQDTASRIMKGLAYGIQKGHEPIMSSKKDQTEEIMAERLEHVNKYGTIIKFSITIDENEDVIAEQNKKREQAKEKFDKMKDDLSQELVAKAHVVKRINEFGGKVNQEIDPEAFELVTKKKELENLFKHLQALKSDMALKEATIVHCRTIIAEEEAILDNISKSLDQQTMDELVRHEAEFRKHLSEANDQIMKLDELGNRFSDALKEIFSSQRMVEYVVGTELEFDNMMRKIEEDEEGRKLGQQRLAEMQRENEESQHLINN